MKTIFFSTILWAMSIANAAPVASDTTKEINAQTTITRGQIDNILNKMNRQNNQSEFKASDYYAQSGEFKANIEDVLRKFEDKVSKVILPKAAFWMNQYNSIYSSDEFSEEQKKIILDERRKYLKKQFEVLSKEYQEALKSVYALIPVIHSDYSFKYSPETIEYRNQSNINEKIKVKIILNKDINLDTEITFSDTKNINRMVTFSDGRRVSVSTGDPGVTFRTAERKFLSDYSIISLDFSKMSWLNRVLLENINSFKKIDYPLIKGKCESSICVGLRSGDLLTLLNLIKGQIDRDIKLKLLDGNTVSIEGQNMYTNYISDTLSRVDYPEQLPFDL